MVVSAPFHVSSSFTSTCSSSPHPLFPLSGPSPTGRGTRAPPKHHTFLSSSLEERIERLIRFPHTLSAPERNELESQVASTGYARELATYFEGFYFEVDALDSATFEEVPQAAVIKHLSAESAHHSTRDWRLMMYVPQVVLGIAVIVATIRGSLGPISAEALTTPILFCFCIYVAAAFLGAAANGTSAQQLRTPAPAGGNFL